MNYLNYLDPTLLKDFERFLVHVNARTMKQYGITQEYDDGGDPALGETVEYFHFAITCDDRMRYIMENIVTAPGLSERNKVGNTIISHFYGARGIHTLLTGEVDPSKAHVDFERVGYRNDAYLKSIKDCIDHYRTEKQKFYGTTELHTSIQTAARNFCRVKYNEPNRESSFLDIVEWIADWTVNGTIDHILSNITSLKDMYHYLRLQPGVGEYYGYHCATSNSVNPSLPFNHDERFCVPGPGARATLDELFKPLKTVMPKLPYGDLVICLRDNQASLFDPKKIAPHPVFHNFTTSSGITIFKEAQDELKTYGTEVACCQFNVYLRLRANPHLIDNRQVARVDGLRPPPWKRPQSKLLEF